MGKIAFADGTIIKDYYKPYVIAEVNSSHNGSIETAKKMIDAAIDAGCDCVKFQSWSSKSLYSNTYYKQNPIAKRFVDKLSLTQEELQEAAFYCRENKIGFSSTPYSIEEVDFLADQCDVPFLKISSMEINNLEYIRYIADRKIPIVLSTGMADYDEVAKAVNVIESTGNNNLAILHCVSVYPTPLDKANLKNMIVLRNLFPNYPIGFSDHTLGETAAIAAVTLGAAVLEKHITLDAKKIGMDNQMAMEPGPLKEFVSKCKEIPCILGSKERVICPDEKKQRMNMRRSIVLTKALKAGDVITQDVLDVKRPGTGLAPDMLPDIIHRTVNKDLEADSTITKGDINW